MLDIRIPPRNYSTMDQAKLGIFIKLGLAGAIAERDRRESYINTGGHKGGTNGAAGVPRSRYKPKEIDDAQIDYD